MREGGSQEEEELAQLCRLLKHALVSTASHVNLQGIDHVIFMTALERKILLRQYAVKLKRSGTKVNSDAITSLILSDF